MARSYSTINSKLWAGRTGIKLRENVNARVVQVYLLSCQSANAIGLFHVALPTIAHETGLTVDEVRGAIAFLRDECDGFCDYDEAVELAWVPRMALFQIGESIKPKDKVRPSLVRSALEWKGHPFFFRFVEEYAERYGLAELQGIAPGTPKQEAPLKPLPGNAEGASAQQDDAGSGRVGSGLSSSIVTSQDTHNAREGDSRSSVKIVTHDPIKAEDQPPPGAAPPEDPPTDDPVAFIRLHRVFSRNVLDPALMVHQLRQAFPDVDLIDALRDASRWLRAGNKPNTSVDRFIRGWVQTRARDDVKAKSRASPDAGRRQSFDEVLRQTREEGRRRRARNGEAA